MTDNYRDPDIDREFEALKRDMLNTNHAESALRRSRLMVRLLTICSLAAALAAIWTRWHWQWAATATLLLVMAIAASAAVQQAERGAAQ